MMRRVSTNGNFAHASALQAKQCQRYVTDNVATPSLQSKKLGLTIFAKLSTVLTRGIPLTEHECKELFRQYCQDNKAKV